MRAVINPPTGTVIPQQIALPKLLNVARKAAPQIREIEDCWLLDPRPVVRFPVHGQRYAIHPGPFINPIQILRTAATLSEAIDPFVLDRHGFRLSDLVEAALVYSDRCLSIIRPGWPVDALPRDARKPGNEDLRTRVRRIATAAVVLNDPEIEAASIRFPTEAWLSACEVPSQAAAAWAWATRSVDELQLTSTAGEPVLGLTLSIRTGSGERPLPVALVLKALTAAVAELSAEAAGDQASRHRLQKITELQSLAIFDQQQGQAIQDPSPNNLLGDKHAGAVAVALPDSRHAFVLGVASGLDVKSLEHALEVIQREMGQFDAASIHSLDERFDLTGVVTRVVVYSGPVRVPIPTGPGATWVHVEDVLDMAMEANGVGIGREIGMDYLWQFLDELSTMPGVGQLLAIDFDDLWRHWLKYGVLNASGIEDVVLFPNPVPDERHWTRAAAWEPIEMVLFAAGFPPSWEWSFTRLDEEPGRATVGFPQHICQVIATPPLILHTPIDPTLNEIGIEPYIAFDLAVGVALTIVGKPDIASAFTLPENSALVCDLIVERDPLSTTDEKPALFGYSATSIPRPSISIKLGPEWFDLLAHDAKTAHNLLGEAFLYSLVQIADLADSAKIRFLQAWHSAPPVLLLEARQVPLGSVHQGRSRLPRSSASRGRARRALAAAVLARKTPTGSYQGSEAVRVCREHILPAGNDALRKVLANWSPAAVTVVAGHLNDAHAERVRRETELEMALAAPWGAHWRRVALNEHDLSERTRPIELVLELLLARGEYGSVQPDRFDIAEAIDLANVILENGIAIASAKSRLHNLAVNVTSGGIVEILPVSTSIGATSLSPGIEAIDVRSYIKAARADRLRLRSWAEEREKPDFHMGANQDKEAEAFVQLKSLDVPGSLKRLDTILKEECVTGFDGISAVLGTAISWHSGDDSVVEVNREDLLREAVAWSGLPVEEIDAALDHLVLEPAQLQGEELRSWEQERRRYRLANRPLIAHREGRLIIIPRLIQATQRAYSNYLLDGRIPWHEADIPQRVKNAMTQFRQVQNKGLESEASAVVDGLGLPHRRRIEMKQAAHFGLILPGEIDLLVADPLRSRLWVCEVKDLSFAVSPTTIAQRVRKFLDEKGYVYQLTRAADAIRANPHAAARLVEISDPNRDWQVIPLMVTRRVEPAGFADGLAVSFVVLSDLAAVLKQNNLPTAGHVPIGGS